MSDGLLQPAEGPDPKIGMVLQDRYRIVRKLGEGGMGAVYEGEHVLIKRRVAIKCLHGQFAQNPEIVARFHREALAATSIGHENIIEVTDMGRFDDGSVFMVLEFLDGRDWSDDIEGHGPQPLGKTVRILLQVCDALTAAHAKGIIHRDLKPENIYLIERAGNPDFVKVLDFGISKFKHAGGPGKGMTQTGTTLGTPYYMAPEQAQGKKDIDHRADVYSLGVILFQALTGQYPFDDESYPMLVLKICTEPPPSLRAYRPDIPPEVDEIVQRALAKEPDGRFADTAELRQALAPFSGMDDAPVVSEGPATASMQSSMLAAAKSGTRPKTPDVAPAPATGSAESGPLAVPGSSKAPLLIGAGIVLLIGGGVAVAAAAGAFAGEEPAPIAAQPTPPPTADPTPPTMEATMEAEAAPSMAAAPTLHVTIRTEPEDAELFLDGDRIPNPFDGRLPQQTEARRLEARKDGYRTRVEDLVLRYDQNVVLRLERGRGTDDRRVASRMTTRMSTSSRSTTTAMEATPPRMEEAAPTPMETAMEQVATPTPMEEPPPTMTAPTPMEEEPASSMMSDLAKIRI